MTAIKDIYIGKVRNSFQLDNETRILHTTNRISAFDFIFPFEVEKKAEVLQALSVYYFNKTAHIIENHFIGCLDETHLLVKDAKVFPIEIVVRGYLTGSLWRLYQEKGTQGIFSEYGVSLPENMKQHQKFDSPIITPSTKANAGHDAPITSTRAAEIVGEENWKFIEQKAIELFVFGQKEALEQGLVLVDTKYEMGIYKNKIILIDEIHTPDSSRYWFSDEKNMSSPRQMSKEFLREEIISILGKPENIKGNPAHHPLFHDKKITDEIAGKISLRYLEMFRAFIKDKSSSNICQPFLVPWPISKEVFKNTEKAALMPAKILVVGNGGRDYSICSAFSKLPEVDSVYYAAVNRNWPSAKFIPCPLTNVDEIALFAKQNQVGLVIAGPELPIAQGLAVACQRESIPVLAPSLECAQLETSKIFCKEIALSAGVKTPHATMMCLEELKNAISTENNLTLPCVIKYDGLAGGKGVFVTHTQKDLHDAINSISNNLSEWQKLAQKIKIPTPNKNTQGSCFLIEELITGEEISVIALCNGEDFRLLPIAQDYKRRNNNQTGPNTGGMGAISPVTLDEKILDQVKYTFTTVLKTLVKSGTPYHGFLFAGFMLDKNNTAWLLEFNCRLGDPETQVLLPGLHRDFYIEILRTAKCLPFLYPEKSGTPFSHDGLKRVFVVGASPEYPENSPPRRKIFLPDKIHTDSFIPSAIEAENTTAGGRAFGILETAQSCTHSFAEVAEKAYAQMKTIKLINEDGSFTEPHFRTDIGAKQ